MYIIRATEFEKVIRKAQEIAKKPLIKAALTPTLAISPGIACSSEPPNRGIVISKEHQDEKSWDGTLQETVVTFDPIPIGVPIGGGLHCRNEFVDVPATIVDDEDWIVSLRSCKTIDDCSEEKINVFVDQATFDSAQEGDFIDLTENKNASTEDPTSAIKK